MRPADNEWTRKTMGGVGSRGYWKRRRLVSGNLSVLASLQIGLLLACQRQPGGGDRKRQAAVRRFASFGCRQAFRRVHAVALRVVHGNFSVAPRPIFEASSR